MSDEKDPLELAVKVVTEELAASQKREKLLAELEAEDPLLRATVSALLAHQDKDPEGARKSMARRCDEARSSRRGRGRLKSDDPTEDQVQAYYAEHGINKTLAHFSDKLSESTIFEYVRRGDKKRR